jgi:CHAD domain-containing protein
VLQRRATTAPELLEAALRRNVDRLGRHLGALGADGTAEDVHQARVATRRMRSDLRTFRSVLPGEQVDRLHSELAWLGDRLGRVRDADVLADVLVDRSRALPDVDRAAAATLVAGLRDARDRDVADLLDAIASDRCSRLLGDLAAVHPLPVVDDPPRPTRLARRRWKQLRRAVRRLPDTPSDADLHGVRKRAKHLRYALEAIEPVTGRNEERVVKAAARLQSHLGDQHDAVVAATWLRAAGTDATDPHVAFVAGELATAFAIDAARGRTRWRRRWRRVRRHARDVL